MITVMGYNAEVVTAINRVIAQTNANTATINNIDSMLAECFGSRLWRWALRRKLQPWAGHRKLPAIPALDYPPEILRHEPTLSPVENAS